MPDSSRFAVGVEGFEAFAAPAVCEMAGVDAGLSESLQAIGEFEEGAEEGGAVILHQFNQAGLVDEAAELDEVTGAGAACLGPIAHVGAGHDGGEPMTLGYGQPQPARRGLKLPV